MRELFSEHTFRLQLCQICRDNPDLKVLKVDWDENKDIAKPLGVRVRHLCPTYLKNFATSIRKGQ